MKQSGIIVLLSLLSVTCGTAQTNSFHTAFDVILSYEDAFRLDPDAIAEWGLDSGTIATNQMQAAIASMSNCVEEATAMIPSVLTNDVSREVFLAMAGHAGTNVFLRVWERLLDVAETNSAAVSPDQVHRFQFGAATPLANFAVFRYSDPGISSLVARTQALFPTNSQTRTWYGTVLSGVAGDSLRAYFTEVGQPLPWYAQ